MVRLLPQLHYSDMVVVVVVGGCGDDVDSSAVKQTLHWNILIPHRANLMPSDWLTGNLIWDVIPPPANLTSNDWLTGNLIWDRICLVELLKTKNVSYFYRKVVFSPHKVCAIVQKTLQCDVITKWRLHCSSISITHWGRIYGPRGDKFVMRSTGDLIRNRMELWMHVLVSAVPRPIRTYILP